MRLVFLIGLFLCFSKLAYAQSDYRPGSIITISRDTVSGYISYTENSSRFESCSFKKEAQGEAHVYKPFEIFGYTYDNDRVYISKEIKNDTTTGKFFLENLAYGKASLFGMRGKFYLEANGSLHELSVLRVPVNTGSGTYILTKNIYQDTLRTYLQDCPAASAKIKSTSFGEKKLIKLVELYNTCFGANQKILKKIQPGIKVFVGLSGGYTLTKLTNFEKTADLYNLNNPEEFTVDNGFIGGISFLISSSRISENIKFGIDVNYQKSSHESSFLNDAGYDALVIRYTALYMPISISYYLNNLGTKIVPVFELGTGLRFILSSESFWQTERPVPPNNIFTENENLVSFKKVTFPLLFGIGANAKITKRVDVIVRSRFQFSDCPFGPDPDVDWVEYTKQFNLNITLGALIKITK